MEIIEGKEQEYKEWRENNTKDFYSAGVVDFMERWAELMERALIENQKIPDCAESLCHEADIGGITGFQYGCAVGSLACFWKYGEELRRWHNLDTQIKDEGERANESGGVLNPAILTIG